MYNVKEHMTIMEEAIYSILEEIRPEYNFKESNNFVEDGFLDSFDVVSVINELEKEFDIIISGLELLPENFESVDSIMKLVERSKNNR